jgi:hypothetical protein
VKAKDPLDTQRQLASENAEQIADFSRALRQRAVALREQTAEELQKSDELVKRSLVKRSLG